MKILTKLSAWLILISILLPVYVTAQETSAPNTDPYLWLEEVEGEKALAWVKAHDDAKMDEFQADTNFARIRERSLEILNAEDRIPYVTHRGGYVYNFWQNEEHVRGIIRRTTLNDYVQDAPTWEVVLDIDKLNEEEGESWVYKGSAHLPPKYRRGLIYLSAGGKDATHIREFDYEKKEFVVDGFYLPEAKSNVDWYDMNTLIVSTDFGPGSLTESGYPRIVKLWQRGTDISEAQTILEGDITDVAVGGGVTHRPEGNVFSVYQGTSFWESVEWIVNENLEKTRVPIPIDANIEAFFKGYVVVLLFSDWLSFPEGSLIAFKIADLESENLEPRIELIFSPGGRSTIRRVHATKDYLVISILNNVTARIIYYTLSDNPSEKPSWKKGDVNLPEFGSISIKSYNPYDNTLMVSFTDFLTPTTLYLLDDPTANPKEIKSLPEKFDANDYKISQMEATSKDGTIIPYFLVSSENIELDGTNPTLLYGYGGFRSSQTPFYSATIGNFWLEKGGVFALANIRGGGEFGPSWHKAALFENRQRAYDDFIAVAEDLIARKYTSSEHLGIMGGSNGGLLVGAVVVQRPDLFNAVVCQVPLLDMLRYHKLPPGASWMGEYGDPDIPEQRAYIAEYSPYQNLKAGIDYPDILLVTSTKDDRVHPGHARKFAARLEEFGNKVYYWEEMEGGHAASADNKQRAKRYAFEYSYLLKMLSQ
jgi:prolyl oligopeptidase